MTSFNREPKRSPRPSGRRSALPYVEWRNIFVILDDGTVAVEDIEDLSDCALDLGRRNPSGIGGVIVVPASGHPPTEANRLAMKRAYSKVSKHLKAMSWMVEGQGFRAATIRAGLAGLRLVLQLPFPTKVTASLEEAVPWLCTSIHTGAASGAAEGIIELQTQLENVRVSRESFRPAAGK
jgi:hypothetical protein